MEESAAVFRETRDSLRAPVSDVAALDELLLRPLTALGLQPGSTCTLKTSSLDQILDRHVSNLQVVILEHIIPTWLPGLQEQPEALAHLEGYFYPNLPASPSQQQLMIVRRLALSAYLTLVPFLNSSACPPQSLQFTVATLEKLSVLYPIDSMFWVISSSGSTASKEGRAELQWEEALKVIVGLPAKVANVVGLRNREMLAAYELPSRLVPKAYFSKLVVRLEGLMYELSHGTIQKSHLAPLQSLLVKLQRQGLLNPAKPSSSTSPTPSFWTPIMPSILSHLFPSQVTGSPPFGASFLPDLFAALPAPILAQYCTSLMYHLSHALPKDDVVETSKAAIAFERIVGKASVDGEAFDAVCSALASARTAESGAELRARITVSWVASGGPQVIKAFIERMLTIWTDAKYIKFSLFSRQKDITHHLLLALSRLPQYDPFLVQLSRRQTFLLSLSAYLSHPDASVRRLGMLVAEIMSELTIKEVDEKPLSLEELQATEAAELEAMTAGLEGEGELPKPACKKSAKRLRFGAGMWDGMGDGKEEARWLRSELGLAGAEAKSKMEGSWSLGWTQEAASPGLAEPAPTASTSAPRKRATPPTRTASANAAPTKKSALIQVIGDDDDDPMLGYAPSSPHSSRSASPTQEYLDEIKEDPTLHTGMKDPVKKPVYIQQLVDLLRDRDKPEKVDRALADGERLIRAKRGFGTELEENAELLATMALALSVSYGLDKFEERREGLLIALVACSPKKAAPYLIEQYFDGQFSLHQRAVLLSALALGGREAAGLPNPKPQDAPRIDFPSKALSPALHRKYITAADVPASSLTTLLDAASEDLRQLMISKGAKGADVVPEIIRERRLRVSKAPSKIIEVSAGDTDIMRSLHTPVHAPVVPFKDVAAEYFLLPLINRFWQHFQDASTREARALTSGNRYRGAGTGMVLSPMALEKYLTTVGLLMHAARHASAFLSVLCPEALDLAATIGTRHLTRPDDNAIGGGAAEDAEGSKLEAAVVGAALELALITLDSAQELDGGRTLAMDKGTVVMGVGEWASAVFEIEERGGQVAAGAGGTREGRVRKAAAGVVIRVSEMMEKWRSRMGSGM